MDSPVEHVNFVAYCTAFQAVDDTLAPMICGALDQTGGATSPLMYRDEAGDGLVIVPSFATIMGEEKIVSWQQLSPDGQIRRRFGEIIITSLDPTISKYFIAGAFGVDELPGKYDLDEALVGGIALLYDTCVADRTNCLHSEEADLVRSIHRRILSFKRVRADRDEKLKSQISDVRKLRKDLAKQDKYIAPYEELRTQLGRIWAKRPKDPKTIEEWTDYEEILMKYRELILIHRRRTK